MKMFMELTFQQKMNYYVMENKGELIEELNVKNIFFQDINDLQKSIQFFNSGIKDFEISVFLK